MDPVAARFIEYTTLALAQLVTTLLQQGRVQEALDASEELTQRLAAEELMRAQAPLWRRILGRKKK